MYQKFEEDILKMNAMYKLAPIEGLAQIAVRLPQFEDILDKEFTELEDIQTELDNRLEGEQTQDMSAIALMVKVEMADLLGDIIVYCASEAARWGIPLPSVLQLIMLSNKSKLGADGEPIINPDNGKFEKGPNYWKPEPAIEHLLVEVPKGGQVLVTEDEKGFPTLNLMSKEQFEEWARAQADAQKQLVDQIQAAQEAAGRLAIDRIIANPDEVSAAFGIGVGLDGQVTDVNATVNSGETNHAEQSQAVDQSENLGVDEHAGRSEGPKSGV